MSSAARRDADSFEQQARSRIADTWENLTRAALPGMTAQAQQGADQQAQQQAQADQQAQQQAAAKQAAQAQQAAAAQAAASNAGSAACRSNIHSSTAQW